VETLKRGELPTERDVKELCYRARDILVEESNVQRVSAPVTVCLGDMGKSQNITMVLNHSHACEPATFAHRSVATYMASSTTSSTCSASRVRFPT